MRRTSLILAGITVSLVVSSTPVAAYVDVGHDPNGDSTSDTDVYVAAYDIRSSVRSVVHGQHGRYVRIATRTYDADFWVGSWIYVTARLDARGGRAADVILRVWILDMSGSGCQLETRSGRVLKTGVFRLVGESSEDGRFLGVTCRVPLHALRRTKAIRWKVLTVYGNGEPGFDVAPNVGMYG